MTRPNFHADLKRGHAGELAFQALAKQNGVLLTRTDGRKGDLITSTGEKYEVKSDSYDMSKTANFFIEQYSDVDKGKLGGPYQADEHGCKYFAYYFEKNATAFVFDVESLIFQLTRLRSDQFAYKEVKNIRWVTSGMAVERSLLKPLFVWKAK